MTEQEQATGSSLRRKNNLARGEHRGGHYSTRRWSTPPLFQPEHRCALAGSILVAALGLVQPAAAATPDLCQTDKGCKSLTERASQHAAQTRYEEALTLYQAAYDLSKEPRILVNIGRCHYRLGRSRKAIDAYTKFQTASFDLEPELAARVKQFMEEAEQAIAADKPDTSSLSPKKEASLPVTTTAPLFVPSDVSSTEPIPANRDAPSLADSSSGRPAWRLGLGIGLTLLGLTATGLGAAAISVDGKCVSPSDSDPNQCVPMASSDGSRTISVTNGLTPGIPLLVGGIVFTVSGIILAAIPSRRSAEKSTTASK